MDCHCNPQPGVLSIIYTGLQPVVRRGADTVVGPWTFDTGRDDDETHYGIGGWIVEVVLPPITRRGGKSIVAGQAIARRLAPNPAYSRWCSTRGSIPLPTGGVRVPETFNRVASCFARYHVGRCAASSATTAIGLQNTIRIVSVMVTRYEYEGTGASAGVYLCEVAAPVRGVLGSIPKVSKR